MSDLMTGILKKKYLHEGEKTWDDLCLRFKRIIDETNPRLAEKVYELMSLKYWVPGGSILANLGTNLSLSNCYFIPIEEDSIDGIFKFCNEASNTFKFRGGVGTDISTLRYKGAPVNNAAKQSTGSVSFMPLFSTVVNTIGQSGRRGALLLSIEDSHPDVLDFIKSKTKPDEVFGTDVFGSVPNDISGANISVKLSDEFITAVINKDNWDLKWKGEVIKTIPAEDMFNLLCESTWKCADPGVLFWGHAKTQSVTDFTQVGKIAGNNPCAEEVLSDYGSCNLSAFNLLAYIDFDDESKPEFNYLMFREDIKTVVEFMNWVIDNNNHPLPQQSEVDKYLRKIGIGITGFADALAALGIKYGDAESCAFGMEVMNTLTVEAYRHSVTLAKKYGPCPALEKPEDRKAFVNQKFIAAKMPEDLKEGILKYGALNTAVTTIAPCGSISIILGGVSSGCEPVFALEHTRTSRVTEETHTVVHPPIKDKGIPKENYVTAFELDWEKRVDIQSALQYYCTDSISSTINLPSDVTVDEIKKLYIYAWQKGLKGVTIYRDGSKDSQVLNTKKPEDTKGIGECEGTKGTKVPNTKELEELPDILDAKRHKVYYKKSKTYVNVAVDKEQKPVELFISLPTSAGVRDGEFDSAQYLDTMSTWQCIVRLISLCLRNGIGVSKILRQIKKSRFIITDLPSILYRVLSQYDYEKNQQTIKITCPECGEGGLRYEGGCAICSDCGYSKCD